MITGPGHNDTQHMEEFFARWKYGRPNFITLSENSGRYFVNDGVNPALPNRLWLPEGSDGTDFLMLSDHNRSSMPFTIERIGERKRMINGTLRGYFIADKLKVDINWENLPSRAYKSLESTGNEPIGTDLCQAFTADGLAGGLQMLHWYNSHKGALWCFMSFDNIPLSSVHGDVAFSGYGRVYEMFITDFSYDVTKRGMKMREANNTYGVDFWNISMNLEEA